ncbi:MAG: SRPBCC domain-containing protein [Candidatus Deferrimicrobiaceae bacterium]
MAGVGPLFSRRDQVFKTWTKPERLLRWWGPKDFTSPVCRIDLRPGGVFINCMRSPEGKDYWSQGVYLEIEGPERDMCEQGWNESLDKLEEYLAKA